MARFKPRMAMIGCLPTFSRKFHHSHFLVLNASYEYLMNITKVEYIHFGANFKDRTCRSHTSTVK